MNLSCFAPLVSQVEVWGDRRESEALSVALVCLARVLVSVIRRKGEKFGTCWYRIGTPVCAGLDLRPVTSGLTHGESIG